MQEEKSAGITVGNTILELARGEKTFNGCDCGAKRSGAPSLTFWKIEKHDHRYSRWSCFYSSPLYGSSTMDTTPQRIPPTAKIHQVVRHRSRDSPSPT